MADAQQLIKFDVCIYKREDLPQEEFIHWATKVYPAKAAGVIKKHGIVKWSQTVQPEQSREPIRQKLKTDIGRPNWTVPDYDLVITYWIRSMDDMMGLRTDPEWAELEKDAAANSSLSIGHIKVGYEIVHFENNIIG